MDIKGFKTRDGETHQYSYDALADIPDGSQNPTQSGGLTANAKALLRTLLYGAVYDKDVLPDPATTIEAFLAELDVVVPDSGGDDPGDSAGVYVEGDTLFVVSGVQVESSADCLIIS